jgi:hypothetical protein
MAFGLNDQRAYRAVEIFGSVDCQAISGCRIERDKKKEPIRKNHGGNYVTVGTQATGIIGAAGHPRRNKSRFACAFAGFFQRLRNCVFRCWRTSGDWRFFQPSGRLSPLIRSLLADLPFFVL